MDENYYFISLTSLFAHRMPQIRSAHIYAVTKFGGEVKSKVNSLRNTYLLSKKI